MKRTDLITYVESQGCAVKEDGEFLEGAFYVNLICFDICWIPSDPEIDVVACCDIIYELKIPPPEGMEEDFDRFVQFRKTLDQMQVPKQK